MSQEFRNHCRIYHHEQKDSYTYLNELEFLHAIESAKFVTHLKSTLTILDNPTNFLEIYREYPEYIRFTNIPNSLKTDAEIIKIFAEYNTNNIENTTFQFCDVPQEFFTNISTPEQMGACMLLAKNHTQAWDIFLILQQYTPVKHPENIQTLCRIFENNPQLQTNIFSQIHTSLQDMIVILNPSQEYIAHIPSNYE